MKKELIRFGGLVTAALVLRLILVGWLSADNPTWIRWWAVVFILIIGAVYVLGGTAKVIEETTEVLSEKTKIAGGVLQSLGTAFPDMVLGVMAALLSLKFRNSDYDRAISYAIIAASMTFGSNIYNIGHAAWCVFRQNLADSRGRKVNMFPCLPWGGIVKPVKDHCRKPLLVEMETAIEVVNALSLLTGLVAVCMVMFGKVTTPPGGMSGDLYQLIRPVGGVVFLVAIGIVYCFRNNQRPVDTNKETTSEENFYRHRPGWITWLALGLAGVAILLAAESMVRAIEVLCEMSGVPTVVAGIAAGLIGCLGEMAVVHNFTVNPKGRIGDAVVGVGMDNVVTIMGAAVVAMMGGIFLGGNALILIFVVILTLNSVLMWQISKLKNQLLVK